MMEDALKVLVKEELRAVAAKGCERCGSEETHEHGPLYLHVPHGCPQLHPWHVFFRNDKLIFECADCHVAFLELRSW